MKIDNQDIIRTSQQLRDEENSQLNVHPWRHHRHFHLPTWLVAIPAAAIIGFVLGLWTQSNSQSEAPLTALVDTVYIKVTEPQPEKDSVAQAIRAAAPAPAPKQALRVKAKPIQPMGCSVADDHIRYDLLVRN